MVVKGFYIEAYPATRPGPAVTPLNPERRHRLFLWRFLWSFTLFSLPVVWMAKVRGGLVWWAWLLWLGLASSIAFMVADEKDKKRHNAGVWGPPPRRPLGFSSLREHPIPKLITIALSPHMALIYALSYEERIRSRLAYRKSVIRYYFDKADYYLAARVDEPIKPMRQRRVERKVAEPRDLFTEQRSEVVRLRASLDEIGPAQQDLPEVVAARAYLAKLEQIFEGLPKVLEDNAAKALALQALSQAEQLAETPLSFTLAQQEAYEAAIAGLPDVRNASRDLEAGSP